MNNNNFLNDILIPKKIQKTSPMDLVTISVYSILNNIENSKYKNIRMLKDEIPHTLYELIEKTTITMLNATKFSDINLKRAKKLLSVELFEKYVQMYLYKIIENDIVNINITDIRDNVQQHIYTIFLSEYLENQYCWEYFVENIMNIRIENIFLLLNNRPLTSEQRLVLVNVPDRVSNSMVSHDPYVIAVCKWKLKNNSSTLSYCSNCIEKNQQFASEIEIFSVNGENFVREVLQNYQYWCCKCFNAPLFNILDNDYTFVGIDCTGIFSMLKVLKNSIKYLYFYITRMCLGFS